MRRLIGPYGQLVEIAEGNKFLLAYYASEGFTDAPQPPPESAKKADWVEYAESLGDEDAGQSTKQELIAEHGES